MPFWYEFSESIYTYKSAIIIIFVAELNVNVATDKYNSEVISGTQTGNLLTGNRNVDKYCYYNMISDRNGIIIKFGSAYLINNIAMQLYDKDPRYSK